VALVDATGRRERQAHLLARGFASIFDGESLEGREAWKISEGEVAVDSTDE
jgi:hypothetical protein